MSTEVGICSECGREKKLTKDGLIYVHGTCKGSRKLPYAFFEKKMFDELVESQAKDLPEVGTLWDGIKALWGPLHGEDGVLVKGMILLEYVDSDGQPNFIWMASPYMPNWAIKGMLGQAQEDLTTDALIDSMFNAISSAQQSAAEEEDEDEDEQ